MKKNIINSYNLFRKVLSLAEYLEQSALILINLIDELDRSDTFGKVFMDILNEELLVLFERAHEIKSGLVHAASHQEEVLNNDAQLMHIFKKISEDIKKIHSICQDISEPNYIIDTNGKLTK